MSMMSLDYNSSVCNIHTQKMHVVTSVFVDYKKKRMYIPIDMSAIWSATVRSFALLHGPDDDRP